MSPADALVVVRYPNATGITRPMTDESTGIIMLLTDGQQRSFNEILAATGLDSTSLAVELKLLTDEAKLEQTVVPDNDLYLITAKGLLAAPDGTT